MDIEQIVNRFKVLKGVEVQDISINCHESAYCFDYNNNSLIVGIFDYDYPNTGYCGSILAEYKECFDKWSKVFYQASFPNSKEDFKILVNDLEYIADSLNSGSSDRFGSLTRKF